MKKTKLLAPLFGLATVAAVAAPMMACGPKNTDNSIVVPMETAGAGQYTSGEHKISSTTPVKFTGVKMLPDKVLIGISTKDATNAEEYAIKTITINGVKTDVQGTKLKFELPEGIEAGSEISIQVVYMKDAPQVETTITLDGE